VESALNVPAIVRVAHVPEKAGISHAQDRTAHRGGGLDRAEAEHRDVGLGIAHVRRSPEGLGTVLDEQQIVPPRERDDGVKIEAATEEVCYEHRTGARRERSLEKLNPWLEGSSV
jgi:hypothetical protein